MVYSTIIVKDHRFTIVILFYLPTMIFVLAMMIYSQFILEFNGSGLISIGILISFLAAGIQLSGFSLHKHFNHNDIYHIVQMAGMYFIYKGVLQIKDFGLY